MTIKGHDATRRHRRGMTDALRPAPADVPEDRALLRAAAELTRDLQAPRAWIYWGDCFGSAAVGYGALAGAVLARGWWAFACGVVAVVALYRALLFIHEMTHVNHALLPGFRVAWNVVVGCPLLIPSFMYEGIHAIHHTRTKYGTVEDPEYLPLALMSWWSLPLFLAAAVAMPGLLLLRFGVVGPVSWVVPGFRTFVVARWSGLQINPRFARRRPEGAFARQWFWEEAGASAVAVAVLVSAAAGWLPWRVLAVGVAVVAGVAVLNQVRTLVAHRWENDGPQLTVTGQFLDSTNVPEGVLAWLWAPVGLRWHALHHLLPGVPYHALGTAHRRLSAAMGADSTYAGANYRSLGVLVRELAAGTARR